MSRRAYVAILLLPLQNLPVAHELVVPLLLLHFPLRLLGQPLLPTELTAAIRAFWTVDHASISTLWTAEPK